MDWLSKIAVFVDRTLSLSLTLRILARYKWKAFCVSLYSCHDIFGSIQFLSNMSIPWVLEVSRSLDLICIKLVSRFFWLDFAGDLESEGFLWLGPGPLQPGLTCPGEDRYWTWGGELHSAAFEKLSNTLAEPSLLPREWQQEQSGFLSFWAHRQE